MGGSMQCKMLNKQLFCHMNDQKKKKTFKGEGVEAFA